MQRDLRLRGLSSDHHHALVLVRSIRTDPGARVDAREVARTIAEQFEQKRNSHFQIEEERLLPYLADSARELSERTLTEHRPIRGLVTRLRDGTAIACSDFADALEAYVRLEERELFPVCEHLFPPHVLDEVARAAPHR